MRNMSELEKKLKEYEEAYNKYSKLKENNISNELNLYNLRFRLAWDIVFDFKNNIFTYITEDIIRETYKRQLKLNELWFAYEALIKIAETDGLTNKKAGKSEAFSLSTIDTFNISNLIKSFNNGLVELIEDEKKDFEKDDLDHYFNHLLLNAKGAQEKNIESTKEKISKKDDLNYIEIISIIYGIRNNYVHNGDTAKAGVNNYSTKINLFDLLIDKFTHVILDISIVILNKRINKIK